MHDVELFTRLGWQKLIAHHRPCGNFVSFHNVSHPARHLLRLYKHHGAPVKFSTTPWTHHQVQRTLHRGPHNSCHNYLPFLHGKFVDMINKGQWIVLPYSVVQHLPGLRVSPLGVVPQRKKAALAGFCDYSL